MSNAVTYADLDRLLGDAGLVARRPNDSRLVYLLPPDDILLIFPFRLPDQIVDPFHLAASRRMLVDRGLVEDEDFECWLCGVRFDTCRQPVGIATAEPSATQEQ